MKSPPSPSAPPDSPALLYLLALYDPRENDNCCNDPPNHHDHHLHDHLHLHDHDHDHLHLHHNNTTNTATTTTYYNTYSEFFGSMDGLSKINPFSSSNSRSGGKKGKNFNNMSLDEAIRELRRLLPEALTRFHLFMLRAHKLMSSPAGIDKVLMTLSYTLQLLSAQLPPASASCRTLVSLISDVRVFHRLWGLLGIYSWGHSLLQHPPRDLTIRRIVAAQVLANVGFQVLENAAYLTSRNVVRLGKRAQARLWVWSSRFWMTHVALEFWRLQRVRELRVEGSRRGLIGSRREEEGWTRELVANCAYAPLTLHWSVANGMIGPSAVGALGSLAAVIGLQNAWAATV